MLILLHISEKQKKSNEFFSFPFLSTKKIEQWAGLNIPSSQLWMCVTEFAFLPPNSAGATIHIFSLGLYAKYSPYLVFTFTTPVPL